MHERPAVARAEHLHARVRAHAALAPRRRSASSSPVSSASAPNGGIAERRGGARSPPRRRARVGPSASARTTSWSGRRVCTSSRVSARGRPASSWAPRVSEPAAPASRRGTGARAAPGRGRGTRRARAAGGGHRARCSTASVPTTTSASPAPRRCRRRRRRTRWPGSSAASSSPTRGARPRAMHAQSRRAARRADDRPIVVLVPPQELVTRVAHEQPEAAAPVEHAHREPVGVAQRVGERLGEQARARRLLAPVDDHDARPARALRRRAAARRARPPAITRLDGRRRRHHRRTARRRARRARASTSRACHVGDPLFLERLVGVVDDDRGREVGHRRERGDPPADHDALPARRPPPRVGARRVGSSECSSATAWPRAGERTRERRGAATRRRRTTIVDPSGAHSSRDELPPVVQRRHPPHDQPHREPASIRSPSERSVDAGSCRWRSARTLLGGDAERRTATRGPPSATRPTRRARRRRRAGPRTTTASDVEQARVGLGRRRRSATTQPRTRRPCSGTRTIVPTRTAAQRRREPE